MPGPTVERRGRDAGRAPGAEVLSDASGPYAWRERGPDGRWALPAGDAVLLDEAWWTPLRPLEPGPGATTDPDAGPWPAIRERVAPAATRRLPDRLTAVSLGDVTQDGQPELVVSFRRPFQRTYINITRPRRAWADEHGLSAHVGLYRPGDLSEIWVAGTLVRPVVDRAACDGALAVAYGTLDEPGTVATSAWRWVVFGFLPVEPLPGPGTPICVDIDGDGRTEPAITERSGSVNRTKVRPARPAHAWPGRELVMAPGSALAQDESAAPSASAAAPGQRRPATSEPARPGRPSCPPSTIGFGEYQLVPLLGDDPPYAGPATPTVARRGRR